MFALNKICVATFISLLALACCDEQALEITDVQMNTVETNPANVVTLTKLSEVKSESGNSIYTYICYAGKFSSSHLACYTRNDNAWPSAHDVQVKVRCPKAGYGPKLSFLQIIFSASTEDVGCSLTEGGMDSGFIGISIKASNTVVFNYSGKFYTY